MMFKERWFQKEGVNAFFEYFKNGNTGNPVLAFPTGTGKSFVIAMIIKQMFDNYHSSRVLMLTHVKTLIEQNAEKLTILWPQAPLGIHSAGLNQRDTIEPIIYAGVQSVYSFMKKSEKHDIEKPLQFRHLGWRDVVFIDEAHMLNPDEETMYQYVLAQLREVNPLLKVVGLTATPYRMKNGLLTEGGIFTDMCYDITDRRSFNRLIEEGFLCPLIPKSTEVTVDTSKIKITGSDFNSKELETETEKVTYAALQETVQYGQDRNCWMVFASGINNSESAAEMLQSMGIDALAVHSKLKSTVNQERLEAHKAGHLKCIVSNNKITTGYDCPQVDLIAMLRPTMSVPLHIQMAGRGTRIHPSKRNTLYLDFAKNVQRLGPINDPIIPRKSQKGKAGDAPVWICPNCNCYNHASARECEICGQVHVFKSKLTASAGTLEVIAGDGPEIHTFTVNNVMYLKHQKPGSAPMIRVNYLCGVRMFTEFVGLEHKGFVRRKAEQWWMERHRDNPPVTTEEALRLIAELRMPRSITVHVNKKPYPEILSAEWN